MPSPGPCALTRGPGRAQDQFVESDRDEQEDQVPEHSDVVARLHEVERDRDGTEWQQRLTAAGEISTELAARTLDAIRRGRELLASSEAVLARATVALQGARVRTDRGWRDLQNATTCVEHTQATLRSTLR